MFVLVADLEPDPELVCVVLDVPVRVPLVVAVAVCDVLGVWVVLPDSVGLPLAVVVRLALGVGLGVGEADVVSVRLAVVVLVGDAELEGVTVAVAVAVTVRLTDWLALVVALGLPLRVALAELLAPTKSKCRKASKRNPASPNGEMAVPYSGTRRSTPLMLPESTVSISTTTPAPASGTNGPCITASYTPPPTCTAVTTVPSAVAVALRPTRNARSALTFVPISNRIWVCSVAG